VLVVDASVATLWFYPQARSAEARAVLASGVELVGPPLIRLEVGTALLRAVRRGELAAATARRSALDLLPGAVRLTDREGLLGEAYDVALRHGGSLYDAVYVALARGLSASLVTDDAQMRGVPARLLGGG
jgi:predicted nucleic acid-binding protein